MIKSLLIDEDTAQLLITTQQECRATLIETRKMLVESRAREEENQFLSIEQTCAYLGGVAPETLSYYRRMGLIYYKKGKDGVWYRKGDIDKWLESGKVVRRERIHK